MLATFSRHARNRLLSIAAAFILFFCMTGMGTYLMFQAMSVMRETADHIDDTRSVAATKSAVQALKKNLSATVRDNAYWDDAYRQMGTAEAAAWAIENWGETTEDYPLYDTALVIEPNGAPLMAYHNGAPMDDVRGFFDASLETLLIAARKPDPGRDKLPVAFIRTSEGIALIGASAIQPYADDAKAIRESFKVLVFAKHITSATLSEISQSFSIKGLSFEPRPGLLETKLTDMDGHIVGQFAWPSQVPGTKSFATVRTMAVAAGIVFLALLLAICAGAFFAVRSTRREERMSYYRATHDVLTGLLNRAGLLEKIDEALTGSTSAGVEINLHLIDLDGFKGVNDAWGHAVGDKLIKAVADRLTNELPAGVIAARLGGDEFAVLSSAPPLNCTLEELSARILDAFNAPFDIECRHVEIGGSVGASSTGSRKLLRDELFRQSDLALYRAKELGRGISVTFEDDLDTDARHAAELEQDIRDGLTKSEFSVAFQPLVDARTGDICGVEALARWNSAKRGKVGPDVFIAAAERGGLMDQLGLRIIELAIKAAQEWRAIGLAVNISPLQLKNPYFVKDLQAVVERHSFDPRRLTIEVTEGVLISNPVQVKRAFDAIRKLGVKIALDDFGCGYASIGALREFGFDRMKVDRSLVVSADRDHDGRAVLQATIALANALQIPVTAEGIETERQAAVVKLCGCDELQGYLYSRPISGEEFAALYAPHVLDSNAARSDVSRLASAS